MKGVNDSFFLWDSDFAFRISPQKTRVHEFGSFSEPWIHACRGMRTRKCSQTHAKWLSSTGGGARASSSILWPREQSLYPEWRPTAQGLCPPVLLSTTYVLSASSSVVLASVFCRRGPLICTNIGGGARYPTLLTFCGSTQLGKMSRSFK